MTDYLRYFDLETYIFEDVHQRFHAEHSLGAFDLFSIVIWKANRAKSKIALKLLALDPEGRRDLEDIARALTASLYKAPCHKERLRILMKDWKFALPMASSILSACYPEDFTIYDYRVRELIGGFPNLNHLADFEKIWAGYNEYKARVSQLAPGFTFRDRDKYLYGKSKALQLEADIRRLFQTKSHALDEEQRRGYASNPQRPEEIDEWADEQVWDYESEGTE
jgi:hypothetical protein